MDKDNLKDTDHSLGLAVTNYLKLLKGLTIYMIIAAVINTPIFYMYYLGEVKNDVFTMHTLGSLG
jgi:hypothetical protein